jgi:hypothetical protein
MTIILVTTKLNEGAKIPHGDASCRLMVADHAKLAANPLGCRNRWLTAVER